uniref:Peptidase S8/S53 domain-containing protein n=1 Tax=Oryza meridionalis TaxID=40149 RepID=A0A0E0CCL2_9ORYZ
MYFVLLKPRADARMMDDDELRSWHMSFLPGDMTASGKRRLVHSYQHVLDGFAAWLTEAELEAVPIKPGFSKSIPDEPMYLDTTHSPGFLGLSPDNFWGYTEYGSGVIIRVIDSGINSSLPSFGDKDIDTPPDNVRCNNKVIGARSLVFQDPVDYIGHGTHVASIAAGNFVDGASFRGQAAGTASGIAPNAHLASYKVCYTLTDDSDDYRCPMTSIMAAMEEAVVDGVDIISISLSSGEKRFDRDPVAMGAFRAVAISLSWHLLATLAQTGAGSVDRRISADLVLQNGDILQGEALVQGVNSTSYLPLYYPGEGNGCSKARVGSVKGHIVICDESSLDGVIVKTLYASGAAQVVAVGRRVSGYTIIYKYYGGASVLVLPAALGTRLKDYAIYPDAAALVTFQGTQLAVGGSPTVAYFSGRGPSFNAPYLAKPDILAPGLIILGAASAGPDQFVFKSGTSMATPHISGMVALLAINGWSPPAVRTAMMTTADRNDNSSNRVMDEQQNPASVFTAGAGQVNFSRASNPGLVYDIDMADYKGFICDESGDEGLRDITGDATLNCSSFPKVRDYNLNYPSITVPGVTVQRTLMNVQADPTTYSAKVIMNDDTVSVSVSPDNLFFTDNGQKLSFTVSAAYQDKGVQEGVLVWSSDEYGYSVGYKLSFEWGIKLQALPFDN